MWLRRLGPGLVIIATLGCGAAGALPRGPAEPLPPPRPVCAAAVVPGQPALCMPESSSEIFVVGLPPAHGWERGDWVMLDVQVKGLERRVPMAMAVVMERYPDLARVQVLYQTQARSLDGAAARRISKEDRARLGKYVGRVQELSLARVRIDVGGQDYVAVGDVYQVLSERDHTPIGRLQVTEVGAQWAWAKPLGLGAKEELRSGLDVVYLQEGSVGEVEPAVLVLVVNFDPHDAQSEEEAQAGRGVAKDLADALAEGAEGTRIQVRYAAKERVPLGAGDAEGHRAARGVGQRFGADVVVWGAMRCGKRACAQPRFTVVDPKRLKRGSYRGADVWVDRDDGGFAFKGEAPADPVALGAAILGSVAFAGQRFGDASHYLGLALSKGVLRGDDEMERFWRLAFAMYVRGQSTAARVQATAMVQRARKSKQERWEQVGRGELARIDMQEGKVAEAHGHLEAIRKWSSVRGNSYHLGYALQMIGLLYEKQGRVDESRKLYQKSLELKRRVGDLQGEGAALHSIAMLDAQQGRVDEARKLYQNALGIARRIGHVVGEAATLHNLAVLDAQQGRVEEARKLYQKSLELKRRIGDVQGEAATLALLAGLEAQQGKVDEARKLCQHSLELRRRVGNVEGEAVALLELAKIEHRQGGVEEARKLLQQSLKLVRRIGHVWVEAEILHELATVEAQQGRAEEARKLYQQSLALKRRVGDVRGEAATLHALAVVEAQQGRAEEARKLYQQSLALKRRVGDVRGELAISINLAGMDFDEGKHLDARNGLERALAQAHALGDVECQARALGWIGLVDSAEGHFVAARERWTEALAIYRRLQMLPKIEQITQRLASLESAAQAWQSHATLLAGGGVLITGVQPDGQAAKAGIAPGDILIRYNTSRLDKPATLQHLVRTTGPNKAATLELLRGATKLSVQVRGGLLGIIITDLPKQPAAAPPAPAP